jgi:hypothetical protein
MSIVAAGSLEELFRIHCGRCQQSAPALDWRYRPITGWLPENTFQCPHCHYAFKREPNTQSWRPGQRPMQLTPVAPSL